MRPIQKTPYKSYAIGSLPKGCQLCVKGLKEVVFVTGICPKRSACYFCPISELKFGKDVVYANERPVKSIKEIIDEAKLCESKGAGLTGGDPLSRLDRTIKIIKALKKAFGKAFHIHLYTPLELVNEKVVQRLEKAGLDEIRFHPSLDVSKLWDRLKVHTTMRKGVEIPVIPGKEKETKELIDFLVGKVHFLNLNELEISDTNVNKLYEHGFKAKDNISYGVKGSERMAFRLLDYCSRNNFLDVHYCTAALKDTVQLPTRIARRAKNVKKKYDVLTKGNTLIRGAVYVSFPLLVREIRSMNPDKKKKAVAKLLKISRQIARKYGVVADVDEVKLRILLSKKDLLKIRKDLKAHGFYTAVVEDLPTYDKFEVESEEV